MGTLTITYNGTTKTYTQSGAPVVTYGGGTRLTAGSWSGTKTLKCAGKWMKTDVVVGARTLKCAGTLAKTDIVLKYTVDSTVTYQTITTSGTFTVPSGNYNRVQFFAVGGGGATAGCLNALNTTLGETSAKNVSTGGGGGGYVATCTKTVSVGDTFSVVIGAGGKSGGDSSTLTSTSGSATTVSSGSTVILTAKGGGGIDATKYTKSNDSADWYMLKGGDGGSGGGPTCVNKSYYFTFLPGTGGSNGSNGTYGTLDWVNTSQSSYSVGDSVSSISLVSKGSVGKGAGTSTTFNGVTYAYGGNGSSIYPISSASSYLTGAAFKVNGTGGQGGFRFANSSKVVPTAGTANTGSGGGGYWMSKSTSNYSCGGSTAGGSGVVIAKLWEA